MGAAHGHEAGEHHPAAPAVRRLLVLLVGPFVLLTLIGMVLLWPGDRARVDISETGLGARLIDAHVTATTEDPCPAAEEEAELQCLTIEVRIDEGPDSGQTRRIDVGQTTQTALPRVGDEVVLGYEPAAEEATEQYFFADYQRGGSLLFLTVVFCLVVVALGRWRGLFALLGLAISLLVLTKFALPSLLDGHSPLGVAVVASSLIMVIALYLAHGFNVRTSTALAGTLVSLLLTGVLGSAFVTAARFSGLASEEATTLRAFAGQVDLRGLLLAGMIIGSLGVLDDVTVTQVSAVWELRRANPAYTAFELYRSAVRIGRDHIASTVNTLVLAYAGASLPLLLLFTLAGRGAGEVLTSEIVAQEAVRTLVGSIGLVASVPITTWLASVVATRDTPTP